ncbi:MAG TPA: corrinoid protein [Myxococcota bacterium]|nr:corrinoid protein [Myxococcota bacterium]
MDTAELHRRQRQAILDGDSKLAVELAHEALRRGVEVEGCLERGFVAGIREVGRLWDEGEYFLPELVQGADAMKAALEVMRPELSRSVDGARRQETRIALGTVAGDIHDIGKTLVATVLAANGFEVLDLGRDVADERFVEAVELEGVRILGLSALLTTTMVGQKRVIDLLVERGLRQEVMVVIGGAPVTRRYAEQIGADGFASNAVEALTETRRLLGQDGG